MKIRVFLLFSCFLFAVSGGVMAQTRAEGIREKLLDRDSGEVLVVSHRGDWRYACENSLKQSRTPYAWALTLSRLTLPAQRTGILS